MIQLMARLLSKADAELTSVLHAIALPSTPLSLFPPPSLSLSLSPAEVLELSAAEIHEWTMCMSILKYKYEYTEVQV